MQSEKLTKLTHQSKLSLKRNNSNSSQSTLNVKNNNDNQESCSSDQSSHKENDPCPSNVEDSLADFKSPKEEKPYKQILNRFKIDNDKVKKKTIKTRSKSRKSSSSDVNQPSIESSFFKPKTIPNQTELKESIPCPLCLKPFKDDETCTNHMKTCATKNKVSLKQLLDAKRLQDRQAEERKAMGLLAAPVLPEKKKGFRSKNFSTGDDPQLQLVLAMSESLYEAQQIEELEQAALLAGIPSECIKEMNDETRKITLQKFGFTTNKPATESTSNKSRKKKLAGPTILQTRSKEDKDRVLTERIACIITGDDALTQVQQRTDNFSEEKQPTVLKSKILKEIEKTSNKLWDRSRLTKKCNNFYVGGLKTHFLSLDQKLQSESHDTKHINNDEECNTLCNSSCEYEPIDFDITYYLDKEKDNLELSNMAALNNKNYENDFMKNLVLNWGETLNDSTESDVIVFVKDDKHIYVHKLVFYVQCSNILLDIEPNDTVSHRRIKNKICWPDKDKLSALAFLEFIYCGIIKKYISVFDQDKLLAEVQTLARLYNVTDLFVYIRSKLNELKQMNKNEFEKITTSEAVNKSSKQSSSHGNENESADLYKEINHRKDLSIHVQTTQISHSLTKHNSDPTPMLQKITLDKVNKSLSIQNFNDRRITASPDLFESENEEETISLKIQSSATTTNNLNNTNLNTLLQVIDEEEKEDTEINQLEENSNEHQINSQKTIVNLSRTPSPLADFYEALTPKCRSPEIGNHSIEDITNQDDMQLAEAVTPKQMSPVNLSSFEEDITDTNKISEAVTPRNSPNLWNNIAMENDDSDNNLFSGALTQKINLPKTQKDVFNNINSQKDNKTHESVVNTKKSDSCLEIDNCNVSNAKSQEIEGDYDESIHTAVTPPKSEGMKITLDKNNTTKLKTDLSLFIEKIKKENAKSILDSDSEVDSPAIVVKPRNPFAKRLRDDSYAYLVNDGQKESRKGISLLENHILEDKNRRSKCINSSNQNKTDFAQSQSSNQSQKDISNKSSRYNTKLNKEKTLSSISDEEIKDITVDEVEMSRYSRYKKNNKHDNSIAKYRKELDQYSEQNSLKQNSSINESVENLDCSKDSSRSKKNRLKSIKKVKSKPTIEDITLVSDSDDDVFQTNSSTISNVCNTSNKNNSHADIDKEKSQSNILTHTTISNIQNDSTFPLNLLDSPTEPTKVKDANNKVIDLSLESEEENIHNESTFPYALTVESDNSLKCKKSKNKASNIGKSIQMDLLKKSEEIKDDIEAEISKILESAPDFSLKSGSLTTDKTSNKSKEDSTRIKSNESKKKVSDGIKIDHEHEVITLSPISIISTPERDEIDKDEQIDVFNKERDESEDKERKHRNDTNKIVTEFDTIDSGCFDEIQFDDHFTKSASRKSNDRSDRKSRGSGSSSGNNSKNTLKFENSVSNSEGFAKSNSPLSKLLVSPVLHETSRTSPILSQSKRKPRHSFDNGSIKPSTSQRRKRKSMSPQEPSNLEKEDKNLDEDNLSMPSSCMTPKNKKNSSEKTAAGRESMTPSPDYSILETPELQKRLNKFGVKRLSRPNAKLMLRHIYNETHKKASQKRASSTSEDEEPPPKKKNDSRGSKKTNSKEKTKSNKMNTANECPVIAEEMDYDDPDVPNNVDNSVSITDVFYKLLHTNKDLCNKVLTYEPLSLESLQLMLKQSGFKCKINSLMDFLDEQCITFQVQNGKGNRTKRKKNKK